MLGKGSVCWSCTRVRASNPEMKRESRWRDYISALCPNNCSHHPALNNCAWRGSRLFYVRLCVFFVQVCLWESLSQTSQCSSITSRKGKESVPRHKCQFRERQPQMDCFLNPSFPIYLSVHLSVYLSVCVTMHATWCIKCNLKETYSWGVMKLSNICRWHRTLLCTPIMILFKQYKNQKTKQN